MGFDEDIKKALEEGLDLKSALRVESFLGKEATTQEVETGIPRTPGYEPDYGETMKEQPQSSPEIAHDPDPAPASLALSPAAEPQVETVEAIAPESKLSEFEKALETLQQQGQQPDQAKELER